MRIANRGSQTSLKNTHTETSRSRQLSNERSNSQLSNSNQLAQMPPRAPVNNRLDTEGSNPNIMVVNQQP